MLESFQVVLLAVILFKKLIEVIIMYIDESLVSNVFGLLSKSKPVIVASRYTEDRNTFVEYVFRHFVAENGGDITLKHACYKTHHNSLVCKNSDSVQLEVYFDCKVVECEVLWKEVSKDKYPKILSCQLNSLGTISKKFMDSLYDSFNSFTLVVLDRDSKIDSVRANIISCN